MESNKSSKAGLCVLDIECSPETSIPLWQHFGFTKYPGSTFGYRFIDQALTIANRAYALKWQSNSILPINSSRFKNHTTGLLLSDNE